MIPLQNFNNLNKNSSGIDQYGEYIEQTYGDPEFDQKRDDFLQTVSQQEQQTFGGGMNSFTPSTGPQPSMGRPMFQLHTSGPVIGSPFGGSANQPLPSSPYETYFPNFNVPTFFQEGGSVSGPPPTHGPDANGVSNRRMFRNRDSRKKLAQMGGILSSSPELQETAMTFANGGGADLPDYIINVPGLTVNNELLRVSSATLEKLNDAVPYLMSRAKMVTPVDILVSEGRGALIQAARPGDELVGTRINRINEVSGSSQFSQTFTDAMKSMDLFRDKLKRIDEDRAQEQAILDAQTFLDDKGRGTLIPSLERRLRSAGTNVLSEPPLSETERLQREARSMTPMDMSNQDPDFANTVSKADQKRRFEDAAAAAANSARLMAERGMLNNQLESGIAKAVPTEVDSEAERLLQAERERVLKLQALNKMQEPTVTPAEELQSVTGSSSVLSSAGEAIKSLLPDEFGFQRRQRERRELAEDKRFDQTEPATKPSTEELLEVASSILSDEQREAIASGEISDRAKALLTGTAKPEDGERNELDDLFKKIIASQQEGTPGGSLPEDGTANYLTPESMAQAQRINVGSVPYLLDRATGKAYRADGAPITAAEQGTVDKFLATEQGTSQLAAVTEADAVAKEAKIASVQQALIRAVQSNDVEGQIALREELKNAQEPTVKVEPKALVTGQEAGKADEAEELSAEISENEKERNRKEQDLEGATLGLGFVPPVPDKSTELLTQLELAKTTGQVEPGSSPLSVTKDVQTTISDAGADAGLGQGFGGDGSIGDLTKDYVKLLKSLLGESDEDKAARKGELFMLMGAALMSGKSSNALTNIGDALQIGAKAAIQDRATRKKRDDTIGLKGFEMAADRIAKRDAQQLALDKEGRDQAAKIKLIDARLAATNDAAEYRFNLENAGYKKMGEYTGLGRLFKTAQDGFTNEGIQKPKGITLLEYFEKLARESNYSQAQIDRYNFYFGIEPSAVKPDGSVTPSDKNNFLVDKDKGAV